MINFQVALNCVLFMSLYLYSTLCIVLLNAWPHVAIGLLSYHIMHGSPILYTCYNFVCCYD